MKTAIYIEDGLAQLVITPESEFEKSALHWFSDKKLDAQIHEGSFYGNRAGWVRHSDPHERPIYGNKEDQSLIIVARTSNA